MGDLHVDLSRIMDSIVFPRTVHLAAGTGYKAIPMPTNKPCSAWWLLKRWKILSIH